MKMAIVVWSRYPVNRSNRFPKGLSAEDRLWFKFFTISVCCLGAPFSLCSLLLSLKQPQPLMTSIAHAIPHGVYAAFSENHR